MLALALLLSLTPQQAAPTREERVLELLRTVEREKGSWRYRFARFEPWRRHDERDGEVGQLVAVDTASFCGTFTRGIDDARFRVLGLELLRAYGLAPEADVLWLEPTVSARLDGLDRAAGIGFEIRGRGAPETRATTEEHAGDVLDDDELEHMRASGLRLYVAERERWVDDEDGFTPALAFAADLVRFLNEGTDGEDVDLGGLLMERETSWVWDLRPSQGTRLEEGEYGPVLVVERAGTLTIPCRGWPDFRAPSRPRGRALSITAGRDGPFSTRGAPSVVVAKYSARALEDGGPRPRFRTRYRQSSGLASELVHETRDSLVAFLPSAFDLAQPFVLELELEPGRYSFYGGSARVGAAAGRR